jgi:hypothetical protein
MTRRAGELNGKRIHWKMFHLSQANPAGSGQDNVPRLLRRLAKTVADLGPADVHDITYHVEITEEGREWPSMTVYYTLPTETRARGKR